MIAIAAGTPTPTPILADVGKPLSLVEGALVSAAELKVVEVEAAKMGVFPEEIEADVEGGGGEVTGFVWLVKVGAVIVFSEEIEADAEEVTGFIWLVEVGVVIEGFPLWIRLFMKIPCPA